MGVLASSFLAAYALRFFLPQLFPAPFGPSPFQDSLTLFAMAVPLWTVCFVNQGLYGVRRVETATAEVFQLAKATLLALLLLVFTQYFSGAERYSRGVILAFGGLSFVMLSLTRALARRVLARLRARGFNRRRAVVLGTGETAAALLGRLEAHPELGIEVVEVLGGKAESVGTDVGGRKVTGVYEDLPAALARGAADQVYLAMPAEEHARQEDVLELLKIEIVDVRVVPDVMDLITLRGGVEDVDGLPIVHLTSSPLIGVDALLKRGFDLLFGSLILLLAAPVMLACALIVRVSSPGPILYRQERMGLDGRVFHILKFRSMPVNAEAGTGAVWAKADENRAFAFGALMRKYSLDELPQFLNVLRGEMSLVGPRPERPVFIQEFKHRIPRYNLRHKMKAGITGLAQVEGWRGNTSLEKRIERDLYYIEHWSIWLDFKILVRTALGGFLSRNAY
ncbi:MAG: undecaprenyl-phosphate glucose phosphotransferase [Deltaproteobacteria bacterium]|nr:undecaprenyl-phosphate glucose phosphotransferase [Deltaproteobacteria bacterium]